MTDARDADGRVSPELMLLTAVLCLAAGIAVGASLPWIVLRSIPPVPPSHRAAGAPPTDTFALIGALPAYRDHRVSR